MRAIGTEVGATPAQPALAWIVAQGDDIEPIPGTRRVARVEENTAAHGVVLSRAQLDRLEALQPASGARHDDANMASIDRSATGPGRAAPDGGGDLSGVADPGQGSGCRWGRTTVLDGHTMDTVAVIGVVVDNGACTADHGLPVEMPGETDALTVSRRGQDDDGMTPGALLMAHIVAGGVGLLTGPVFVFVRRSRPVTGPTYQVALAATAVSGGALAVVAWDRLWWLLPVAVLAEASAVAGLWLWRRRRPGWTTAVPHVLGGSYVALLTGAAVAGTGNPLFWIVPAVMAQWPIAVAKTRLAAGGLRAPAAIAR